VTSHPSETLRWRNWFDVGSTIAMVLVAGALVWEGRGRLGALAPARAGADVELPKEPIAVASSPLRGSAQARVAMVEFADFECPACIAFTKKVEPSILRDYVDKGRVLFVFKHFPLEIHKEAKPAAEAAVCAGDQSQFWQAHDWMYAHPLHEGGLEGLAGALALDRSKYEGCLKASDLSARLEPDRAIGDALRIRATPTFFFGKVNEHGDIKVTDVLVGAGPLGEFTTILNRLLN